MQQLVLVHHSYLLATEVGSIHVPVYDGMGSVGIYAAGGRGEVSGLHGLVQCLSYGHTHSGGNLQGRTPRHIQYAQKKTLTSNIL